MTENGESVRDHLVRLLDWEEAHVGFDKAFDGIPAGQRGARAAGFEHSPWQLLEHIRIAQQDILDFCANAAYEHKLKWPDDYWPKEAAPPASGAWAESIASYRSTREQFQRLARDASDLTARVPTGKATQTYLRALLLAADHAAYHVGQVVSLRRALGLWS